MAHKRQSTNGGVANPQISLHRDSTTAMSKGGRPVFSVAPTGDTVSFVKRLRGWIAQNKSKVKQRWAGISCRRDSFYKTQIHRHYDSAPPGQGVEALRRYLCGIRFTSGLMKGKRKRTDGSEAEAPGSGSQGQGQGDEEPPRKKGRR